jgi:hypothetical protein
VKGTKMSYLFNQRKKTIKQFKKEHGKQWYIPFSDYCRKIRRQKLSLLLGNLLVAPSEDILIPSNTVNSAGIRGVINAFVKV